VGFVFKNFFLSPLVLFRSLTKIKVSQSFREEILFNQHHWNKELELSEGESALWINGINIGHDLDSIDLFHLFETLRQEHLLANYFKQIGYKVFFQF